MLEIRRGTAARSYENTFFRQFSENLKKMFEKYNWDGLLIANSECEEEPRLQIDALLIAKNCICLIDFKNFEGDIILPQNDSNFSEGKWVTGKKVLIKGGSSINPYKQLYIQKGRFSWVYHTFIKEKIHSEDIANPSHTKKIVCFQKPINLKGSIPLKDEIDFCITDSNTYLETIKDIIDTVDKDINLSAKSHDAFKQIFRADPFYIKESYEEDKSNTPETENLNNENLYQDQLAALEEIREFFNSGNEEIFILQGTSLSGKSHLISYIKDTAFDEGIPEVELFTSSSRVAKNLLSDSGQNFNSIYSYIYGGTVSENDEEENEQDSHSSERSSETKLETVPIKKSDNEDRALFIIDESQLVSDSYYEVDNLRFGSGKLLQDLIEYTDFKNTHRKLIFIGDPFQTSMGKHDESPLKSNYLDSQYDLKAKTFELIDKGEKSTIVGQSLKLVNGVRSSTFNQLSFDCSEKFQIIDRKNVESIVENSINNNPNFHLLTYKNKETKVVNDWIKKSIIKNGEELAPGDLIIFENTFQIGDINDPFSNPKKIYNGQFGNITKVQNTITETINKNAQNAISLKFREVSITLKDTGEEARAFSLENYRLSNKGELSGDERYALQALKEEEINKQINQAPFENSCFFDDIKQSKEVTAEGGLNSDFIRKILKDGRTKAETDNQKHLKKKINHARKKYRNSIKDQLRNDTSSKYFKYKNVAYLRFGWALTVHKASSYKWDEILIDAGSEEDRGKTNRDYFKWLYTGLTRARKKVYLINHKNITPFKNTIFKDENTVTSSNKNIYFIANIKSESDVSNYLNLSKFAFPEDEFSLIRAQLFQLINSKLEEKNINIKEVEHKDYHEVYTLTGEKNTEAIILFYYNKKGEIRFPRLTNSTPKEFGEHIIKILRGDIRLKDFNSIKDKWRKSIYEYLNKELLKIGGQFTYIIQNNYRDSVKITMEDSELEIILNYDGDGFFSTINCSFYDSVELWETFKMMCNDIRR